MDPSFSLSIGDLLDGWNYGVSRFSSEMGADETDQTVWGAHDFVGTLHTREILQRGVDELPDDVRDEPVREIAAIDLDFKALTEPDHRHRLATIESPEVIADGGWWWRRIPLRGPVRADLG